MSSPWELWSTSMSSRILGVSWCCGNYCLLAFVLWCGYCSVSFQSFVLRHWCPQHQETTRIFDKVIAIIVVAIINTKSSTIAFFFLFLFSFPSLFLFCFPFPSLLWFWSFSGLRNMPFDAFSLKWLQMSLGWFSKNWLDVHQHTSTTFKLVLEILRELSTQSGATDFSINY